MKIVFLDADGTLFHHSGYIPRSALDACNHAKKMGIKFVYAPADKKSRSWRSDQDRLRWHHCRKRGFYFCTWQTNR